MGSGRGPLHEILKKIYTATNLPEAHLLADWLADRGVRTRIFNANASSIAGELPVDAALPQVWVDRPDEATRAREIIDTFMGTTHLGPAWMCARCKEENPGSFELCWACGADATAR